MYDLLIKNARICDGTGAPSFHGSIAVKDGMIAAHLTQDEKNWILHGNVAELYHL